MNGLKIMITVLLGLFLIFPGQALAVEFSIENTDIDARIQESGDVTVTETHTYEFDGEFNGITRELIAKDGSAITDFQASENGDSLKVEQEGNLYRIYRGGEDETISVTLSYVIEDGVEVYEDMGEFYWPFFSEENESDYENMTITLTPPSPTQDVLALGYDEAEGTAETASSGVVTFNMGSVSSGENADVRAAWGAEIFAAAGAGGEIRPELISEIDRQADEAAAFAETRGWVMDIGIILLSLHALLLAIMWIRAVIRGKKLEREADAELPLNGAPREVMSLMATISYNYHHMFSGNALSAALLDLVRKGKVVQVTEREFRVVSRYSLLDHELILIQWLFDEIGNGETFTVDELEIYAAEESNQQTYRKYEADWRAAIKEEVTSHDLMKNVKKQRVLILAVSSLLTPFLILFPLFELLPGLFFTILLLGAAVMFAFSYHPRTLEGMMVKREWHHIKENPVQETWTKDEQMRVYLYGLGTQDEKISGPVEKKFAGATPAFSPNTLDIATIMLLSTAISPGFSAANVSAAGSGAASGVSIGSAGGVGGGGGGSGAF
ncbi:hypothetical protein KP77_09200 [Jeotgalibacillus alimentarius]|uniref:DUF2207 domain-containing protein n=1 Tax=Jeotgalibacillus alimentarius TaxID=135826 RepID=A0A0C2W5U7_9BACL|nr:DUF2207 domain-containing protein [Jeotgalibacillus alimentarius]KIL51408.1 hypothetical protein KP77_09200 [Jeotgalibacillus alimentarius]